MLRNPSRSIRSLSLRLEALESRLTPDASAQAVVTGLYHQVLLREPDPTGLAAHTRALESGATTGEVGAALYASREFREAQVGRYYDHLLNRPGDQAGVAHWADRLFAGLPEETVSAAMASSPEYTSRFARPADLVSRWYLDLLGRQPDSLGLQVHTRALESGRSAFEVTSALTSSAEFRSVKVRQVFFAALGRDADTAGQEAWTSKWQVLGGLAGVTSGILGSAENHARLVSSAGVPLPNLELAKQWNSILQAPYDESENGFVWLYNDRLRTTPRYDEDPDGGNDGEPIRNEPSNMALWNLSRSGGEADGLPGDEMRVVTPVTRPVAYPLKGLLPTQNEVDMDNSLKFPLTNPTTLELYLKGGDIQHPAGLIITGGDGRYVLNGHHRWSAMYTINPQARILSVDLGLGATPEEFLKMTQIAVGADLGFLPVANASDSNNLFNVPEATFRAYVEKTINEGSKSQEVLDVFARYGYSNMAAIQDYLWSNVQQLRANNQPAVDVQREVMPQPWEDDPAPVAIWLGSGLLNFKSPVIAALG
jgi:hypothetical protein